MNFIDKLAGIFGFDFVEAEDEQEQEVAPATPAVIEPPRTTFHTLPRLTEEISQSYTIFEPKSYDECQIMADKLKKGQNIIIKYGYTTTSLARCIYYFMDGCIYALNGSKEKISNEIFLYLPKGVEVKRDFSIDTHLKTPWK